MKKIRNLVLSAVTVLCLGASVASAAAAAPVYVTQYSWNGNNSSGSYNYATRYNYYAPYNYYTSYYGYKPAPATKPATPVKPVTAPTPVVTPPTPATNPAPTAAITAEEQQMVGLVNQERTSRGLAALMVDPRLVKVARMKSQDMIDHNYFAHQSPTYGSPFDMMHAQGITYQYAGENLAGAQTVPQAHTNLMNSPGHRDNILNPNYTKIGIGVVHGGPYGLMISQEFTG